MVWGFKSQNARIQNGGGVWIILKNHKNIGFLSNTGQDPLKNHKATRPAFNVGPALAHKRNAILMASQQL